ncbi:esterase-like activity of phytase family protein [[Mycobacterium] burgundiense]|uniref:Esterase-like activity of phytase family protein n=1 Tax=[Mycobacterium] burgundiense TaxID=3064286 RepID=A0ABM9LLF2_9MYCO|nr:esterase-like activity of phytase family protein [Mycolicibacterium sp. MU0053]CAJ1500917.1 esterase-like activity of phytase family protein [Mycolicibacterium sp. MU0053]
MRWVLTVVLALVAGAACTPVATADELRYADQTTVAHGAQFDGTVIGGLSAISYHPGQRRYYVLSDDKAQHGPVRFYTAEIPLSDNAIDPVRFTGMQPLAGAGIADAEGLAVDAVRERLYWSTEGGRPTGDGTPVLQAWIRIAGLDGSAAGEFALPANLVVDPAGQRGIRPNNGVEGLTLSPSGQTLFAGLEEPLLEDPASLTRITAFDVDTRKPFAQYAYRLEPAPAGRSNGLSGMVALSETEFLVIERAGGPGPTIRVFRAEIGAATDTLVHPALPADVVSMTKTLVADLSAAGGPTPLDNIEGITLGPAGAVVLVSDNNFNPAQVTQFLLMRREAA